MFWEGGERSRAGRLVTLFSFRTHANGSIKRGNKDNATESVSLRTGIGVQLKDIKVFNRARQKGGSEGQFLMWGAGTEANGSLTSEPCCVVVRTCSFGSAESGRVGASCPVPHPILPVPPPGTNICAQNNGGCQQLCLFRGGGQRTCACAHRMLSEDGVSCRDYDGYLLYSERTILKSIHLSDENNLNAPIKPFEDAEHMKNVIALAFDYRYGSKGSNRIFYSDIHFGNIQQINDDGTGRKTIVESEWCGLLPSVPALRPIFLCLTSSCALSVLAQGVVVGLEVFGGVWRGTVSCEVSEEPLEVGTGIGSSLQSSFWHGERVTRLRL